jgi:ferredoxin-like protein FixX
MIQGRDISMDARPVCPMQPDRGMALAPGVEIYACLECGHCELVASHHDPIG